MVEPANKIDSPETSEHEISQIKKWQKTQVNQAQPTDDFYQLMNQQHHKGDKATPEEQLEFQKMMEKILKPHLLDQRAKTTLQDKDKKSGKSFHHCLIIIIVPLVELKQVKLENIRKEIAPIVLDVKQEIAK